MKKLLIYSALIGSFVAGMAASGLAAEHEAHHPAGAQSATAAPAQGMTGAPGMGMGQMPCPASSPPASMPQMMGMMPDGMSGMMGMMASGRTGMGKMANRPAGPALYLDRIEELKLSTDQVARLKALRSEDRRDTIRTAAELQIARLDLSDLLSGDNWSLKNAEPLVRKLQTLEGDIQVRHLKAVSDARQVLTPEQLKQAASEGSAGSLESLFQ